MKFDRSFSIFSMTYLKCHQEYFHFRCKIHLALPVRVLNSGLPRSDVNLSGYVTTCMNARVAEISPGLVSPARVEDEDGARGLGPAPRDRLPLVVGVSEVVVDVIDVDRGLDQCDADDEPRRRATGVLLGVRRHAEVLMQEALLLTVMTCIKYSADALCI